MLFVTQLLRAQPKGGMLRNQIESEWMCYTYLLCVVVFCMGGQKTKIVLYLP